MWCSSSAVLRKINHRLDEIISIYDKPFGGIDVFLCIDFKQLPPIQPEETTRVNAKIKCRTHAQSKLNTLISQLGAGI